MGSRGPTSDAWRRCRYRCRCRTCRGRAERCGSGRWWSEGGLDRREQGQRRRKQEGKGEPYHEPASKQPFTSAHLRPVVSRFGGIVMESAAVDIPVQAGIMNDKGQILSAAMMDNDNDFDLDLDFYFSP